MTGDFKSTFTHSQMFHKFFIRKITYLENKSLVLLLKKTSSKLNICFFSNTNDCIGHRMCHHSGIIFNRNIKMQMFIQV